MGAFAALLAVALYLWGVDYVWEPTENAALGDTVFRQGRQAFYADTHGSEIYLAERIGLLTSPLSILAFARASFRLAGHGTSNLQVELDSDVTIGKKRFVKGQPIDTGLDVPRGSFVPLGIRIRKFGSRIQLGVTCAFCHSTVSAEGRVLHGAPNSNLNIGLLLALTGSEKDEVVSERFSKWPPGTGSASSDIESVPEKIPAVWTGMNHELPESHRAFVTKEKALAIVTWENAVIPPRLAPSTATLGHKGGAQVFLRAGCVKCHSGPALGSSKGPGLLGLYWRAPYLTDGGVAMGFEGGEIGLPLTLLAQRPVDPVQSLHALFDRDLRGQVILANSSHPDLRQVHVKGAGHEHWVDRRAGFLDEERQDLIAFLLSDWREGTGDRTRAWSKRF